MTLKIITTKKTVRRKIEVVSFDEAKSKIELFAKEGDVCYVQIASSMRMAPEKRYEVKPVPVIKNHFAENGRVLSRREIKRLNLA